MKPILYLDIDDTLIMFPPYQTKEWWEQNPNGRAAPGAKEFVLWTLEHFEVRWLTCWALGGRLPDFNVERLSKLLDINSQILLSIENPRSYTATNKLLGINFDESYWWWIEDGLCENEKVELDDLNLLDRWIECNASLNPNILADVKKLLEQKLTTLQK